MKRIILAALTASALSAPALIVPALADPLSLTSVRYRGGAAAIVANDEAAAPQRGTAGSNLGGGFIEFLFSGGEPSQAEQRYRVEPQPYGYPAQASVRAADDPRSRELDPQFLRQTVDYRGAEPAGTVIINTRERFLYLVEGDGTATRWGIGVGKPGFTWGGTHHITAKREWPDWHPPKEMLQRRPDLPHFMAGGPENPLGARAMYLGSTLYRIHGSNEPWTIGQAVSSGCIRMRNEDVIDLFGRVKVGTKVVVI